LNSPNFLTTKTNSIMFFSLIILPGSSIYRIKSTWANFVSGTWARKNPSNGNSSYILLWKHPADSKFDLPGFETGDWWIDLKAIPLPIWPTWWSRDWFRNLGTSNGDPLASTAPGRLHRFIIGTGFETRDHNDLLSRCPWGGSTRLYRDRYRNRRL
jgi:hypothetical protein